MLQTLPEVQEEGLPEEEHEEIMEEPIPYKRFGYSKALPIIQDEYDFLKLYDSKERVKKFKFSNEGGLRIEVMDFGATIVSVRTPDKFGDIDDILLGFDTVQDYYKRNCKFGAMLGRTTNIIEDAYFKLGNDVHFLRKNAETHHRDGGLISFDKIMWKSYIDKATNTLIMTYLSENKEEGYPGNVLTKILMYLSDENEFIVTIDASCDSPTPVDISPRLFFNLAGHGSGEEKMRDHKIMINADMYIMQDSQGIPTGRVKHVNQTYFDLRIPRPFHAALDRIRGGGYKHTFCLNNAHRDGLGLIFAARLEECNYGRYIEIYTNAPSLYFSTANNFPETPYTEDEYRQSSSENRVSTISHSKSMGGKSGSQTERLFGKENMLYFRHGAVALSPQGYPNSVNMPTFPSCIIRPHQPFQRKIIYKFGVSRKILTHPKTNKDNDHSFHKSGDYAGKHEENHNEAGDTH
ncbi:hypothetical protein WDU94_015223 [Cyamophila willieti]